MSRQDIVFTGLVGKYESLNELNLKKNADTRYVCFTDDPNLVSDTWEVIVIRNENDLSPVRLSRKIKMLGHTFFPENSRILYIDNTVTLKIDGAQILDAWLSDCSLAFMEHSSRKSVRNEFFICSAYGLDSENEIYRQFRYYRKNHHEILDQKPHWGGMIARINNREANLFMETWFDQYQNFSRRDQLSINVSQKICGVEFKTILAHNSNSKWHNWPIHTNRDTTARDSTSNKKFRKLNIIWNAIRFGPRYYFFR